MAKERPTRRTVFRLDFDEFSTEDVVILQDVSCSLKSRRKPELNVPPFDLGRVTSTDEEYEVKHIENEWQIRSQKHLESTLEGLQQRLTEISESQKAAANAVSQELLARRQAVLESHEQDRRAVQKAVDEFATAITGSFRKQSARFENFLQMHSRMEKTQKQEASRKLMEEAHARAEEERVRSMAAKQLQEQLQREAQDATRRRLKEQMDAEKEKAIADRQQQILQQQQQQQQQEQRQQQLQQQQKLQQQQQQQQGGRRPISSQVALQAELATANLLDQALEQFRGVRQNVSLRDVAKSTESEIKLQCQNISATKNQIRETSKKLIQILTTSSLPAGFTAVEFARKIMSRCEAQVQQAPGFAFSLAHVVVEVSRKVPHVTAVVIGRLNRNCILTVPKYFLHSNADYPAEGDYFKQMGYEKINGGWESTDSYVSRMRCFVCLFGAILQLNAPEYPVARAWQWCACLINKIPPNRISSSVLEAFLQVTGYSLHKTYKRAFQQLLKTVLLEYLPKLSLCGDRDAEVIYHKLEAYVLRQQFLNPPEGSVIPDSDASAVIRA